MIFYERLANAIVEQAAKYYMDAVQKLKNPNLKEKDRLQADSMKKDCECFFLKRTYKNINISRREIYFEKLEEEILTAQS